MKQFHLSVLLLIVLCSFIHVSCKKEPPVVPPEEKPPVYRQSIFLSVADSGLTEIYLKLSITDSLLPRGFALYRNNAQILSGSLFGKETIIIDPTVQLNTSYSYQAFRLVSSTHKDSSNYVMTKTMDTTDHTILYKIDELGDGGSQLFDVAIISDSLIYAVGNINIKDSAGNWITPPYNLAKWDGIKWELSTLYYQYLGQQFYGPIYSIHAFNKNNIWYGLGNLIHWNGNEYTEVQIPINGQLNKIYGVDENNIYVVGYNGSIVHYDGSSWQKIESGTLLPINDVFGAKSLATGQTEVLAVAGNKHEDTGRKLFRIIKRSIVELDVTGTGSRLQGVGFSPGRAYYVVGAGIHYKKSLDQISIWNQYPSGVVTKYFTNSIFVNSINDIFIAGDFGELVHFNGATWKNYSSEINLPSSSWVRIQVKRKTIIAVGDNGIRAVVLRGMIN